MYVSYLLLDVLIVLGPDLSPFIYCFNISLSLFFEDRYPLKLLLRYCEVITLIKIRLVVYSIQSWTLVKTSENYDTFALIVLYVCVSSKFMILKLKVPKGICFLTICSLKFVKHLLIVLCLQPFVWLANHAPILLRNKVLAGFVRVQHLIFVLLEKL